ncbi:MAG: fibronectin type III domain-containing protein [bacterium]|nr:fibronectin type III domain-containing protein [bacterium]
MKKILFLIAFLILFPAQPVRANFSDSETSLNNSFSASSLDFSLSENPTKITKDGLLDFNYQVIMQIIGGDAGLCAALQVETKRDGIVVTGAQTITGGEDNWEFSVSPSISDPVFSDKTCSYNFKFQGWQTDSDGSWGFKDEETSVDRVYTYVAPPTLSVTNGSWVKNVAEKITNGNFSSDLTGWTTAGDVTVSSGVAKIGSDSSDPDFIGNYVWENRLMQSFDAGAKTLSFNYDFFTRDYADNPGFFVRLNGAEVFSLSSSAVNSTNEMDGVARNTGWQTFYYDLSDYVTEKINLIIYAGNTTDTDNQSWVYIDNVTTALATAPIDAVFNLSGVNNFYKIDSGVYTPGSTLPSLTEETHSLDYYSTDAVGNKSPVTTTTVITDGTDPGMVSGLLATPGVNFVTLNWMATGDDGDIGRASKYEVTINGTTIVENIPAPKAAGEPEELIITGLDPNTIYNFSVKAADEAPNWGVAAITTDIETLDGSPINPGDLVINELMWAGSQFIELRNMTSHPISLSGLILTKFGDTLIWTGAATDSISENGFFLINNPGLDLDKNNLQIKLLSGATLIDEAWDGTVATEGLQEGTKYYSMERTSVPGDGANQLSWYTCIDGTTDVRSTPGEANRSENEKINKENAAPVLTPEPVATPSAEIIIEPTPTPEPTPEPTPTLPPADAGASEGQVPEEVIPE